MHPLSSKPPELNFPWPFPKERTFLYRLKSAAMISFVYLLSKTIFFGFNKLIVKNKKTFIDLLEDRSRPLITITNHRCNVDDPLMWYTSNTNAKFCNNPINYNRMKACIKFKSPKQPCLYDKLGFFSLGRCVPCVRGAGVFQTGVDFCIETLSEQNAWVHIFPEGKVTKYPIRIKWGISRLIAESKTAPILLPIWLNGMQNISPETPPYYPKIGKEVEIIVGQPIDTRIILDSLRGTNELERRKEIADAVQSALFQLGGVDNAIKPPSLVPPMPEKII